MHWSWHSLALSHGYDYDHQLVNDHINVSVQESSISTANTLEILQACTKPSIWNVLCSLVIRKPCRSSPKGCPEEPGTSSDVAPLVSVEPATREKRPSLLLALAKVYGPRLIVAHSCKFVYDVLNFAGPLLQGWVISWAWGQGHGIWIMCKNPCKICVS